MYGYETLLSSNMIKKVKELRIKRLVNINVFRSNLGDVVAYLNLPENSNVPTFAGISTQDLKTCTGELLEQTRKALVLKIEKDLPLDEEDIRFALKLEGLITPSSEKKKSRRKKLN